MNNIQTWNLLVGAKQPTVAELEALVGCVLAKVYEHAPNFLCAQPNLLFRLPMGTSRQVASPVTSMTLILEGSYLSALALVRPNDLQGLSIFGMPLQGSATAVSKCFDFPDEKTEDEQVQEALKELAKRYW